MTVSQLDQCDDSILNRIHGVLQRSYREEARLIGTPDFPPLNRTIHDLRAANNQFFGCWRDGELAAVIEVSRHDSKLGIDSLVVDPRHFRQGLASEMLRFVLGTFDWGTATVETAEANVPAIALYEKFGFIVSDRMVSHGIAKVRLRIDSTQGQNND